MTKSKKGGLRTMPFIIANEAFEKVAGVGLHANMIFYLILEYHMSGPEGANVLFLWGAISNFLPIIGASISDSFLGRFRVIALGTFTALLGMILLWLTAIIPAARPPKCNPFIEICPAAKPRQLGFLFSSFVLMSIGAGGIRPCSLAFGADQFHNPDNPNNERILQTFFNWYYASVGLSYMASITLIVYIQDKAGWVVGFGVPVGLMLFSTVMFILGSSLYIKPKANKVLFTGFGQVISAAWKNRHLPLPPTDADRWYYYKGSKLTAPTEKLRFLNRACVVQNREKELDLDGKAIEPWKLCTVKQVEELKAIIKVLPIWSSGIMIAVTISQYTFPQLQAKSMDRHIFSEKLKIPPGSFGVFAILTLTIWVAIYDRVVVPLLSKFTNRPRGLSYRQRIGIGLAISCVAMAVAALVERKRRSAAIREGLADNPEGVVALTAMWLVPQNCLIGLAEAFNAIGQIEFYYSQFPKTMSSIGVALLSLGMAVGNLVGSLIVTILNRVTGSGGKVSWVSTNVNRAHYDYYYWILCILSVVNFFYFIACSWAYGSCEDIKVWDEGEAMKEHEMPPTKESPIVHPRT
ncbi:protein NRT1/ PTR FAMILY 1.2 [Citrus sinensis]|nr:protein NRT1/ PTR FAMILY 1.2 [Citrus sinensis]